VAWKFFIWDGLGGGSKAAVTKRCQLVTAPLEYSDPITKELAADDTAVNFIEPQSKKQYVITEIITSADRNVTGEAHVVVYESTDPGSLTASKVIIEFDIAKNGILPLTGLNWITTAGVFINGKTDDDNAFLTISGYFVTE